MKRAAYIMATHNRPERLDMVLRQIETSEVPDGWDLIGCVAGHPGDAGRDVARRYPWVGWISAPENVIGKRWNAALYAASDCELVLLTGDDDLQSSDRVSAAIEAHESGAKYAGTRSCYFHNPDSKASAFWEFQEGATGMIGATVSANAGFLRALGGWPEISVNLDSSLIRKLSAVHVHPVELGREISHGTVCLHGSDNLTPRPWPLPGKTITKGTLNITGVPFTALPEWAQRALA